MRLMQAHSVLCEHGSWRSSVCDTLGIGYRDRFDSVIALGPCRIDSV